MPYDRFIAFTMSDINKDTAIIEKADAHTYSESADDGEAGRRTGSVSLNNNVTAK